MIDLNDIAKQCSKYICGYDEIEFMQKNGMSAVVTKEKQLSNMLRKDIMLEKHIPSLIIKAFALAYVNHVNLNRYIYTEVLN